MTLMTLLNYTDFFLTKLTQLNIIKHKLWCTGEEVSVSGPKMKLVLYSINSNSTQKHKSCLDYIWPNESMNTFYATYAIWLNG